MPRLKRSVEKATDPDGREKATQRLDAANASLAKAEKSLAAATSALDRDTKRFASSKPAWDATSTTLTLPLDAYGVCLVRLE